MTDTIKAIIDLCLNMLGAFTAGLIFLFCMTLLIVGSCLAIMIGRDLYEFYIKATIRRLKEKYDIQFRKDLP